MKSWLTKRFSSHRSPLTKQQRQGKVLSARLRIRQLMRKLLAVCIRILIGIIIGGAIGWLYRHYGASAFVSNDAAPLAWQWSMQKMVAMGGAIGGIISVLMLYWLHRSKQRIIRSYQIVADGICLESCTLTDLATNQPTYTGPVKDQLNLLMDLLQKERLTTAANESRLDGIREIARQADLAKTRFLAQMSHEIRTPINGVLGMVDLLLNSGLTSQQDRLARIVKNSGLTLLQIINDLLDFAKIEEGKLELEEKPYDIRQLAEEIVEMLGQNAFNKGIEIGCYISPEIPQTLIGDPFRFRQIFTNLLGNAIKFTTKGEVSLAITVVDNDDQTKLVEPTDIFLRFAVKDTGIGIPSEDRHRIFQAFSQGKEADAQRVGGTGLGLSIASQLVNMMGGSLRVDSQVNIGSTFSFSVAQAIATDVANTIAPIKTASGREPYVLVADPSPISQQCFSSYASTLGIHAVFVERAHEVFSTLQQSAARGEPFHRLFTTPQLPDMAMDEFLPILQATPMMEHITLTLIMPPDQFIDVEPYIDVETVPILAKPLRLMALKETFNVPQKSDQKTTTQTSTDDYLTIDAAPEALVENSVQTTPILPQSVPTAPPLKPPVEPTRPYILVAEDNPVNAEVTKGMLKALGFSVRIVVDGIQAVQAVREEQFVMVLMDGQMPNMDGVEATITIRNFEEDFDLPPIPIIAVTANTVKGVREEHLAAGMDAFLTKPFTQEQLVDIIQPWVGEYISKQPTTKKPSQPVTTSSKTPPPSNNNSNSNIDSLPTLERSALESIRSLQSDDEQDDFLHDIVNLYLQDTEEAMGSMTNALKLQDYLQLGRIAHKVKSGSGNIGAAKLAKLSYAVEQNPQQADILKQVNNLQQEFSRVRTALLSEIAA